MKEIPFTKQEPWSNFYNRMTADNYDYYIVCFCTNLNSGLKYMGSTILTREYLDIMNSNTNYAVSVALQDGANVNSQLMRNLNNVLVGSTLYKIYGVKL